jgi:hypothetical protein
MTRRIAVTGLTILALCLGSIAHAFVGPLDLVMPGVPSPTDFLKLIDNLTRKDTSTTVEVNVVNTISQGRLLIARTRVDVALDRASRNWRGCVRVHLTVPSDISYSVDLTQIRPEHIRLDLKHRRLIVTMPMPQVEDVTPILGDVKTANSFKRCRFKRLDMDTSRELQNTMLKEDFLARARQMGETQLPEVRAQGRGALQAFLQRLVSGTSPGVTVVVE